jgi:DNA-binding NarL/FixJ family response regulator
MSARIKVGIADDDEMVCLTLRRLLGRSADIQVVATVDDGGAAVFLAQTGAIDVLIMDWEMPTMNGPEALEQIRLLAPAVKVIIHSNRPASKHAEAMLEAGASAYLEKPCTFELLVQAVRNA